VERQREERQVLLHRTRRAEERRVFLVVHDVRATDGREAVAGPAQLHIARAGPRSSLASLRAEQP
jgi:hypothetical protein